MTLPSIVAKANRRIVNPVFRQFAGKIPPFAIVEHRGRKSGKLFRTPLMVFPAGDEMLVALTYGKDADWVKNIVAAGECTMEYRQQRIALTAPRLSRTNPNDQPFPFLVRTVLRIMQVNDFLRLRRS